MLTAEQHAIRLRGIGASEIASVVAADGAWDTPLAIWAQKVGLVEHQDETEVPEHIELGTLLEPVIAALYTRRTGNVLVESGTLTHPTDPIQIATPDRLVVDKPWTVQIKKARSRSRNWGQEGTDEIPESIICQCMWELSVTDRDVAEVPVLFFGSHLAIYRVTRDNELISGLVELAHKFWRDHVVANVPPTPDGSERARETLAKMYPANRGNLIRLGMPEIGTVAAQVFALAQDYTLARDGGKDVEDHKEAAGNALRLLIGDADGFDAPWGSVTWKRAAAGKPAWKDIAQELGATPELITKYTTEPTRTLRVNLKKPNGENRT